MAEQMKNLSDEILLSYKQRAAEFQERLKENAAFVNEVQKTLDGFRNDQIEMAATLRSKAATLQANIAKGQKERIKSFEQMMSGIHGSISEIQQEVEVIKHSTADMLKDFSVDHDKMSVELHKDLDADQANRMKWNTGRLKEFNQLMKGIQTEITRIQKEVSEIFGATNKLLMKFSNEHSTMSVAMRADLKANLTERIEYTKKLLATFDKKLAEMAKENQKMAKALKLDLLKSRKELSKSDEQRLKDFNVTFSAIQLRVHQIQKYVNAFLTEFSDDRKQAAETWKKLEEAIANMGKPESIPEAKKQTMEPVKPVAKKEEPKKEVAVENEIIEVIPVLEATTAAEQPKELNLEDKVLNYINKNTNGVKVSEMEAPLNETRMRLGFITKKLLEESKIQKVENLFYPLAK